MDRKHYITTYLHCKAKYIHLIYIKYSRKLQVDFF